MTNEQFFGLKEWKANWIWASVDINKNAYKMLLRKKVSLEGSEFKGSFLRVTADARYKLYVNDKYVGEGPARADLWNWNVDTWDLSAFLSAGNNVISAEVLTFGTWLPIAVVAQNPGFLADGAICSSGKQTMEIHSDDSWKWNVDESFGTNRDWNEGLSLFSLGFQEECFVEKKIQGWRTSSFDDSLWQNAKKSDNAIFQGRFKDFWSNKVLKPRDIPLHEEKEERFLSVIKSDVKVDLGQKGKMLELQPNQSCAFILDAGKLTTGFPKFTLSGAKGRKIRFTYAETLFETGFSKPNEVGQTSGQGKIRVPDRPPEQFDTKGYYDSYSGSDVLDVYEPFTLRCFRYLKIDISTGESPFVLHNLSYRFSAYPFVRKAEFVSSDPMSEKLFDVGFWTARMCAHDHYEDCPYYERGQYYGDTRLQMFISYVVAGDSRLVKRSIDMFFKSMLPEGMTQSRYPTSSPHIIPSFSLYGTMMVEDYLQYTGDDEFIRKNLFVLENIYTWFKRFIKDDLLRNVPYWNFTDWRPEWMAKNFYGEPPTVDGVSSILNLHFVNALQSYERILKYFGEVEKAKSITLLIQRMKKALLKETVSQDRSRIFDAPGSTCESRHAYVWAILCDLVDRKTQQKWMDRLLSQKEVIDMSLYMDYYLFRALYKLGRDDQAYQMLDIWKKITNSGYSTFPETPEPDSRSECHAWSAWIIADFITEILGIKPLDVKKNKYLIAPRSFGLNYAKGKMPVRDGSIEVQWQKVDGKMQLECRIPAGISADIRLESGKQLHNVTGNIKI